MLRIAVQSKGRLYDETMMLLEEAGIKLNRVTHSVIIAKGFSGRWYYFFVMMIFLSL